MLLRADGTVACVPTTGNAFDDRSNVLVLKESVYVAAGYNFEVSLKPDGTEYPLATMIVDSVMYPHGTT